MKNILALIISFIVISSVSAEILVFNFSSVDKEDFAGATITTKRKGVVIVDAVIANTADVAEDVVNKPNGQSVLKVGDIIVNEAFGHPLVWEVVRATRKIKGSGGTLPLKGTLSIFNDILQTADGFDDDSIISSSGAGNRKNYTADGLTGRAAKNGIKVKTTGGGEFTFNFAKSLKGRESGFGEYVNTTPNAATFSFVGKAFTSEKSKLSVSKGLMKKASGLTFVAAIQAQETKTVKGAFSNALTTEFTLLEEAIKMEGLDLALDAAQAAFDDDNSTANQTALTAAQVAFDVGEGIYIAAFDKNDVEREKLGLEELDD